MIGLFFENPIKCIAVLIALRFLLNVVWALGEERYWLKSWNRGMLGILIGVLTIIAILMYNIYISAT